jgi:hypothetical protein
MGRFLSPDPSGGHFMNPQSLNRYAYVHNNPLSMIDPTGMDCVYTQNLNDDGTVGYEQGDCTQEGGYYVNGSIDLSSLQIVQGDNDQYSLNFDYTDYDLGPGLGRLALSGYSPLSSLDGGFGFGSWNYAANVFSQAGQTAQIGLNYSMALTAPNFAAMTGISGGGQLITALQTYGPQALSKFAIELPATIQNLFAFLVLNPKSWEIATDFIQGLTPGTAPPATWAGLGGAVASNWQQLVQAGQQVYQEIRGSVPH